MYEPDPDLRDTEQVPLQEDIDEYIEREVLPHVTDAWIDYDKTAIGYEISFTRHFYRYEPLRNFLTSLRTFWPLRKRRKDC